jgi:2-dehydropantoate 2-reductase
MKVKKIALIGMGAVGIVYGRLLYDKFGSNFTVISDESRKDKLKEKGFTINGYTFYPNISSNGDNKDKYDLIIFAAKNFIDDVLHMGHPYSSADISGLLIEFR